MVMKKAKKTEKKDKDVKIKVETTTKKELDDKLDDIEEEVAEIAVGERAEIKASKPIASLKRGDKLKVDGVQYEVDAHYVLIDHKRTKEMAIEIFNTKTDKDYQLRYFSDQVESTMEFYELQEILYVKRPFKKIEW